MKNKIKFVKNKFDILLENKKVAKKNHYNIINNQFNLFKEEQIYDKKNLNKIYNELFTNNNKKKNILLNLKDKLVDLKKEDKNHILAHNDDKNIILKNIKQKTYLEKMKKIQILNKIDWLVNDKNILNNRINFLKNKIKSIDIVDKNSFNIKKNTKILYKNINKKIIEEKNYIITNHFEQFNYNKKLLSQYNQIKKIKEEKIENLLETYHKIKKNISFWDCLKNTKIKLSYNFFNFFSQSKNRNEICFILENLYEISKKYLQITNWKNVGQLWKILKNNKNERILLNKKLSINLEENENLDYIKFNMIRYHDILNKIYEILFIKNDLIKNLSIFYEDFIFELNSKRRISVTLQKDILKKKGILNDILIKNTNKIKIDEKYNINLINDNYIKNNYISNMNTTLTSLILSNNNLINSYKKEKFLIYLFNNIFNFSVKILSILNKIKLILKKKNIINLNNNLWINLKLFFNEYNIIDYQMNTKNLKKNLLIKDENYFNLIINNPIIKFFNNINIKKEYDTIKLNYVWISNSYKNYESKVNNNLLIFKYLSELILKSMNINLKNINKKKIKTNVNFSNSYKKSMKDRYNLLDNNYKDDDKINNKNFLHMNSKNINSQNLKKNKNINFNNINYFIDLWKNNKKIIKNTEKKIDNFQIDLNISEEELNQQYFYNNNIDENNIDVTGGDLKKNSFRFKIKNYKNLYKELTNWNFQIKKKIKNNFYSKRSSLYTKFKSYDQNKRTNSIRTLNNNNNNNNNYQKYVKSISKFNRTFKKLNN